MDHVVPKCDDFKITVNMFFGIRQQSFWAFISLNISFCSKRQFRVLHKKKGLLNVVKLRKKHWSQTKQYVSQRRVSQNLQEINGLFSSSARCGEWVQKEQTKKQTSRQPMTEAGFSSNRSSRVHFKKRIHFFAVLLDGIPRESHCSDGKIDAILTNASHN